MSEIGFGEHRVGEHDDVSVEDLDDPLVQGLGKLSEALERVERARGALYEFHQLTGGADAMLDEAVELLEQAGRAEAAERVRRELIGRNVLPGRWTFQVVEEYDDGYYGPFREVEASLRGELAGGERHRFEAALKLKRRGDTHI